MGLLERIKGYLSDETNEPGRTGYSGYGATRTAPIRTVQPAGRVRGEDELAVDRYRYLLRTASPDEVEEVHAEAFAKLTPQQRRMVFEELFQYAAASDRPASDDPRTLARSATRSELRQPGFLERTLGLGTRGGSGLGTAVGGSLLGTVAGVVIGSAIAGMVLPGIGDLGTDVADGVGDLGSDIGDGFGDIAGAFDDLGGDF